jgi:hypothetical protein
MPIRAEHRWLYPIDWPQLSGAIRFGRANGRCERCHRPHLAVVEHHVSGTWWDASEGCWRDGGGKLARPPALTSIAPLRLTRVVLACAHLDHDPTNNAPRNLAAFCQRCHMLHDAHEHQRRRWINAFRRRALGDLFLGSYCAHAFTTPVPNVGQASGNARFMKASNSGTVNAVWTCNGFVPVG